MEQDNAPWRRFGFPFASVCNHPVSPPSIYITSRIMAAGRFSRQHRWVIFTRLSDRGEAVLTLRPSQIAHPLTDHGIASRRLAPVHGSSEHHRHLQQDHHRPCHRRARKPHPSEATTTATTELSLEGEKNRDLETRKKKKGY